jgi:hypothetical protein
MVALLAGCKKGNFSNPTTGTGSSSPPIVGDITSDSPGSSTEYVEGPPRRIAYEVNWTSANARASDAEHFDLTLKGVTGKFFKDGRAVAAFSAESGTAVHATGLLTLQGTVRLRSIDPKSPIHGAVMSCDTVTYRTAEEIIKAHGNVSIESSAIHGSGINDLWCSNDLSQIATPDLYVPVRHNLPNHAPHK